MRKFTRSEAPAILTKLSSPSQKPHWQVWGERYTTNRQANPGFKFQWPQVDNRPLNQHLLPDLHKLTDGHCAYCDHFPLKKREESIDHFLPKSNPAFYMQVCRWENLYYSCLSCQGKTERHSPDLLRPDDPDFTFGRYFIYNYQTHQLEPNPLANPDEQRRAEVTIELFNLSDTGHSVARRHAFDRWTKSGPAVDLSDFNYRFMFE